MIREQSPLSPPERRVIRFRGRAARRHAPLAGPPPVANLDKFQRTEDNEDYRHRMLVNVAALLFVVALVGIGLWLATTMAEMRKNQDCVLSGRHGCTPVEYSPVKRY